MYLKIHSLIFKDAYVKEHIYYMHILGKNDKASTAYNMPMQNWKKSGVF